MGVTTWSTVILSLAYTWVQKRFNMCFEYVHAC
jgi:hypothetical protein